MQLKQGTFLQGGKYKIEKVLGQGGFGITYLATQDILERKVAIKEFFFKEFCEREEWTNTITLGTQANKTTVEKFLKKFIKEAQTISALHHPNIVQIHDIFRENNTAYYVMEYIDGNSLGDIVKTQGALPETKSVEIIKKVAVALDYIHTKNINHLDVKPNNIMVRHNDGEVILIDFGVAKQYDEKTKEGTTTTPVGISHGYSPSEQYKRNGVSSFSPESDIYSLGATLYKMVTGITPPEAIEVAQEGLPEMPSHISEACKSVIRKSMMLNKADRPHNIAQFLDILNTKTQQIPASFLESAVPVEEKTIELTMPIVEKEESIYGGASVDEREEELSTFDEKIESLFWGSQYIITIIPAYIIWLMKADWDVDMGSNILFNILAPAFIVIVIAYFINLPSIFCLFIKKRMPRWSCHISNILLDILVVYLWYVDILFKKND